METVVGPPWRRRVRATTLLGDWTVWWTDAVLEELPAHRKHPIDDGVERNASARAMFAELAAGAIDIRGDVYEATRVEPTTHPDTWADWFAYVHD